MGCGTRSIRSCARNWPRALLRIRLHRARRRRRDRRAATGMATSASRPPGTTSHMPDHAFNRTAHPGSVETRASWTIAIVALAILALAYGGPLLSAIAMKPIAAELDAPRSAPALAS